jgi:hypothetical protein
MCAMMQKLRVNSIAMEAPLCGRGHARSIVAVSTYSTHVPIRFIVSLDITGLGSLPYDRCRSWSLAVLRMN